VFYLLLILNDFGMDKLKMAIVFNVSAGKQEIDLSYQQIKKLCVQ